MRHLPILLRRKGLSEKLLKICQGNDVVFLAIFGSYIRGAQNKKSDIDIAIEFDREKSKTLLDLVHLEYELKKVFKKKVDLGILSSISPYIIESVRRQMRVIYDQR